MGWRACRFPLPSWALSFSCSSAPACRTDSCLHPNLPAPIVGDPSLCIPLLGGGRATLFWSPSPMEGETRELFLEQERLHNK